MVVHFAREGEMLGQYPEDGVARLLEAHAISPSDYYWHEGMMEWAPVALSRWMPAEPAALRAEAATSTKTAPDFTRAAMA